MSIAVATLLASNSENMEIEMLDLAQASAAARITDVVGEVLAKHGVNAPVAEDADLGRYGMTSIDMVELMLGVEAAFDVAIPPAEITLDNFRSVAAIAAMVSRLAPAG